jgi:hypothetical protein
MNVGKVPNKISFAIKMGKKMLKYFDINCDYDPLAAGNKDKDNKKYDKKIVFDEDEDKEKDKEIECEIKGKKKEIKRHNIKNTDNNNDNYDDENNSLKEGKI